MKIKVLYCAVDTKSVRVITPSQQNALPRSIIKTDWSFLSVDSQDALLSLKLVILLPTCLYSYSECVCVCACVCECTELIVLLMVCVCVKMYSSFFPTPVLWVKKKNYARYKLSFPQSLLSWLTAWLKKRKKLQQRRRTWSQWVTLTPLMHLCLGNVVELWCWAKLFPHLVKIVNCLHSTVNISKHGLWSENNIKWMVLDI